jgi:hypothetical protein
MICLQKTPLQALTPLCFLDRSGIALGAQLGPIANDETLSKLKPFRCAEATPDSCFHLSVLDCLEGLQHAMHLGWFDRKTFDCKEYDAMCSAVASLLARVLGVTLLVGIDTSSVNSQCMAI